MIDDWRLMIVDCRTEEGYPIPTLTSQINNHQSSIEKRLGIHVILNNGPTNSAEEAKKSTRSRQIIPLDP